jgi:hypothetical protein
MGAGLNSRGRAQAEGSPHRRAGSVLASAPGNCHILGPMAGSPLKRQRKAGIRADDGSVIGFPYMPRAADLPPGWRHWSPAQRIEHLRGILGGETRPISRNGCSRAARPASSSGWGCLRCLIVDISMLTRSMLSFAGIKPIRESLYGLAFADEKKRARWIQEMRERGD